MCYIIFTPYVTPIKLSNYTSTCARATVCACGERDSQVVLAYCFMVTESTVFQGKVSLQGPQGGGV